ncbi:hypothetical protein ACHAWF_012520 [Thalassiosira exigua]
MAWLPAIRSAWKVVFAVTALVEIQYIALLMKTGDDGTSENDDYCRSTLVYYEENDLSINYTIIDRAWESTLTMSQLAFVWAGPFFCSLCLVEALVRAVEARNLSLNNRMLDDMEKSLLEAARRSTIRLSMFFVGPDADQGHKENVTKKVSRALRLWVPAITTIAFWLFILPTSRLDFQHSCGSTTLHDSAVVTQWINEMKLSLSNLVSAFHGAVESVFWTKVLPYRIHKEPQRFLQRLQVILRWIRFGRFAFPLFRMGLKLQDQVRTIWKARRQSKKSDMERQRRLDRPSMIFSDIQKLLETAKVQTALARIPSFSLSPKKVSSAVVESYNRRRDLGKKVTRQLSKLQRDYFYLSECSKAKSEIYDRIVKMTQDITVTINSDTRNFSHRYLKSLRSLLSSRKYLISPRTRFSLAWRMTVTNCLLLEIGRLCASWHISQSFSISLSQIVARLLVNCKEPEETKRHLAFITDHLNRFRQHMFDMFPLFGPPPIDVAVCVPSGPQALLILHSGRMLEFFVDVVVFMDIFVWFLTGDIDADTHAIIPKPFFTRCILPGTLVQVNRSFGKEAAHADPTVILTTRCLVAVQVLDHPTLPDLLPGLLKSIIAAFADIGYSRCIRWTLALIPALKILVFDPATSFFFEHIEEDEGLMHMAESLGVLSPERKSTMLYGSTGSLGTRLNGEGMRSFFRRMSSDVLTSQVGLAYDTSPPPSQYNLQDSMAPTEVSSSDGTEPMPPSIYQPELSSIPLQSSPLRNRKSVHFGLFENNKNQPAMKEPFISGLGYPLSSHQLHDQSMDKIKSTQAASQEAISIDNSSESLASDSKAVHIGGKEGEVVINPSQHEIHASTLSTLFTGPDGEDEGHDKNVGFALSSTFSNDDGKPPQLPSEEEECAPTPSSVATGQKSRQRLLAVYSSSCAGGTGLALPTTEGSPEECDAETPDEPSLAAEPRH